MKKLEVVLGAAILLVFGAIASKGNVTPNTKSGGDGGGNDNNSGGTGKKGKCKLGTCPNPSGGSRGDRNNNLGNIKKGSVLWNGEIPHAENTDGVFAQFYEQKMGNRAMIKLIKNYMNRHGLKTISEIITRYSATDRVTYIDFVAKESGFNKHQRLNDNKETLRKIIIPMVRLENGFWAMSVSDFNEAYKLI